MASLSPDRVPRPSRSRRRGSTILYAMTIAFAAAVVAVAGFEVAASSRRMQSRREDAVRLEYVMAAARTNFQTRALSTSLLAMNAQTMTVGGETYNLTYAKGSGLKEILVTIKQGGQTVGTTRAIDPRGTGLQLYGLATKDLDMDKKLVLGSAAAPTHAFFGKTPKKTPVAGSVINGAVDTAGIDPKYTVTGPENDDQVWSDPSNCRRLVWIPSESYAGSTTVGGRNVNGFASGYSYLIYVGGKATITGTFTGRVTVFAGGGIVLKPPILVTPGSELVMMSDSDCDVQGTGRIDGHLYTAAELDVPNAAGTITWTGSIVAKSIVCKTALNLTLDPFFYGDAGAFEDFYLPTN